MNKLTRRDFLRMAGISTAALMASRLTKASNSHRQTNIVIIIGDDIETRRKAKLGTATY